MRGISAQRESEMGFFGRIFRPAKHDEAIAALVRQGTEEIEKATQSQLDASYNNVWTGTGDAPAIGTRELLAMYKRSPRMRAILSKIATMIAGVPWHVGVTSSSNAKALKMCSTSTERNELYKEMAVADELKLIPNHPALQVIEGGNQFQTGMEMQQVTQTFIDLKGEGYWWLQRNGAGIPTEALPIPPHWMVQVPGDGFSSYRISQGTLQATVPPEDIVPFRDPDPLDPYGRGTGIGESLGDEIDGDEYATKIQNSTYRNRAVPLGLVGIEGAGPDAVKQASESFDQDHRGPYKAGRIKFHNGKLSYTRIAQTFEELQLIDGRDFSAKVMIETFGLPPELLGRINESKRSTIDHAIYIFTLTVLVPRLDRQQSVYDRYLLPQYPSSSSGQLVLGYTSPVPEDAQRRLAVMKSAPWAFSKGEWRREAKFVSDDKQDQVFMIPSNLFPSDAPPVPAKALPCGCGMHEPVKALPPRIKAVDPLVESALEALRPELLTQELQPVMTEDMQAWGAKVLADLNVGVAFDMLNPLVVEALKETGDKIKDLVNETTKKALRDTLEEGIRNGEDMRALRERVHDTFLEGDMDIYNYRAWRIARTETIRASNAGNHAAFVQSGVVEERQWLAALINTRPEHIALNGDIEKITDPFTIDGASAMYPGGFGVASLDINCMCTTLAVVGSPKSGDDLVKAHELYVHEIMPWQMRVQSALTTGFQAQLDAVLDVLGGAP